MPDLIKTASASFPKDYNTVLLPDEYSRYAAWAGNRVGETKDYDMQGYWKKYAQAQASINESLGHFPDVFKKPSHITFSNESIYHSAETPGGKWERMSGNKWSFAPSDHNIRIHGVDKLKEYFAQREPGNTLLLPNR